MVVLTEGREPAQLAMDFTQARRAMPRPATKRIPRLNPENAPSAVQLRGEISNRLRRYAVCSLAKMLHGIKKSNPAGYPYYLKELFRIFNAYEENGKVGLGSIPTPKQTAEAHSLLLNLERQHIQPKSKKEDPKWRGITQEHQHAASAKEHFSNLCTIAGLNALLKEGQYDDFLLVFDSLEKPIMEKAREPARPWEPRVSGHEVRLYQEMRNSGIPEKAGLLSNLEKIQ